VCPVTGEKCFDGACRIGTEQRSHFCAAEREQRLERLAFDQWLAERSLSWPPDKPVPPRPWDVLKLFRRPEDLGL
jgi:hypothetical protein